METNVKCTKPHCNCVEMEERRTGGPVKSYPCLAYYVGQKNSLDGLKSIEDKVKTFSQATVSSSLELLGELLNKEYLAAKRALSEFEREKALANTDSIENTMQMIRNYLV